MRSWCCVLLVGLALGCTGAHERDGDAGIGSDSAVAADSGTDAGTVDASFAPDALAVDASLAPDAPLCPSDSARCTSATTSEACDSGAWVTTSCEGATPYCDRRTGRCTDDACGDGVLHADESCDDDPPVCDVSCVCDVECRVSCNFDTRCPATEACVPWGADSGHCMPRHPGGLGFGEPCAADDSCESGWCDAWSQRCGRACDGNLSAPCPDGAYCEIAAQSGYGWTPGGPPARDHFYRCEPLCSSDSECGAGAVCTLRAVYPEGSPVMSAACLPRLGSGTVGSAPIGSACDAVLGCDSNTCVDGRCTRVCADDADCAAPLPHCVEHDFAGDFGSAVPRVARVCGE